MKFVTLCFIWIVNKSDGVLRVHGGRDALKDEFPFAVRLELKITITKYDEQYVRYNFFCTGAAISPSWILSAAHCADVLLLKVSHRILALSNPKMVARYNSHLPEYQGNTTLILGSVTNPGYMYTEGRAHKYDIALFRCESMTIIRFGKVSAVDYESFIGHEVVTLGFGVTNATRNQYPLQVLKGILIRCLERDGITATMLCLVPPCRIEATICPGDSGGPVVHSSGIVGVNSMSLGSCGAYELAASSSIVSIVSPVLDWISNTTAT